MGVGVVRYDSEVFVSFAGRAGAAVSGGVAEYFVDVVVDFGDVVGVDGGVDGWWGVGLVVGVWEQLGEFRCDLGFGGEGRGALEDFEGLGELVVFEVFHDVGYVLSGLLMVVVFAWIVCWVVVCCRGIGVGRIGLGR